MRQLGINRRYRQRPAVAGILQVDEVQQAVFEAHAAYEDGEERSDKNCSSPSGNKWSKIKKGAFDILAESGQRKRALRRFQERSEFELQSLVFAQDGIGPYFR
jgi:hypothetical protein